MLRLAFDFIITWRETRTRPNAYAPTYAADLFSCAKVRWTNMVQVPLSLPEIKFDDNFP